MQVGPEAEKEGAAVSNGESLRAFPSLPRVAVISLLFNWPSTGGGNMHTAGLVEFLGRDGYDVRHFYARYPAWGIGRVEDDGYAVRAARETCGQADGGVGDPRRTGERMGETRSRGRSASGRPAVERTAGSETRAEQRETRGEQGKMEAGSETRAEQGVVRPLSSPMASGTWLRSGSGFERLWIRSGRIMW